jgi:hypothetical protein
LLVDLAKRIAKRKFAEIMVTGKKLGSLGMNRKRNYK